MATNLFDLYAKISLDDSDFNSGIDRALTQGTGFASKIGTAFTGISNVGKKAFKAVGVAATAGGVALGAFMKSSISAGMDFDAAMSQVGAISGATGDDFDDLREKAMEMGAKTKFSATESAEAMNYMAMAGWKTEDMLNGIEGVMNLAAASGEDLATTSDIVTDAMTAFGMAANESSHFADVLAASAANSNTNVGMLGESFKYVAPIAGSMGYSVEDTAVALGLMANNGIKASQGGTALRNIITNMAKPTDNMKKAMNALGVSLTDEHGNMLSLKDVMKELRRGFNDGSLETAKFKEEQEKLQKQLDSGEISTEEYDSSMESLAESVFNAAGANKAQYASMLAGKYGMAGLLAIVNTTDEEFESLTDSIYNCDGAAQQMATTMLDNLNGDVTILKSSLEGLQIAVSDRVTPSLRDFAQLGTEYVNRVKEALTNEGWEGAITEIGNIFGDVLNQLISYLPSVADFATKMIIAIVDGISANSGSIIEAGGMILDSLSSGLSQISEKVMPVISQFVPLVADYFMTYKGQMFSIGLDVITAIVQGIGDNMDSIGQSAADMLTMILTSIQTNLPTLIDAGLSIISGLDDYIIQNLDILLNSGMEIISQLMTSITENAPSLFQSATEILTNINSFILEQLPTLFAFGLDLISQTITTISEALPGLAQAAVDILSQINTSILENLPSILSIGLDIIMQLVSSITENLPSIVQSGVDLLMNLVTGFQDSLPDFVAQIPELISQLLTSLTENLPSVITAGGEILTSILTGFTNLLINIPGIVTDMWDSFATAVSEIDWGSIGSNLINGIKDGIEKAWESVKTAVTDIFDNLVGGIKDFLGIHSPSTVFADIGSNMIEGVEKGWNEDSKNVRTNITDDLDYESSVNNNVMVFKTAAAQMAHSAMLLKNTITEHFKLISDLISSTSTNMENTIRNKWNNISRNTSTTWRSIQTNIQNELRNISNSASSLIGSMGSSLSSKLNSIANDFSRTFNNVRNTVYDAVYDIRNAMNFSWSLPHLSLPHISISGSFSLDPPRAPKFSVSWYRKAMDNAMLLNGATIFGAMGGKLLGGGEAGPEVVSGANTLMGMIKDAVRETGSGIGQVIINIDGAQYDDADELANVIAEKLQGIVDRRSAAWA